MFYFIRLKHSNKKVSSRLSVVSFTDASLMLTFSFFLFLLLWLVVSSSLEVGYTARFRIISKHPKIGRNETTNIFEIVMTSSNASVSIHRTTTLSCSFNYYFNVILLKFVNNANILMFILCLVH